MRTCKGCGGEIPPTRSVRALFCEERCKWRHESRNRPSERQKRNDGNYYSRHRERIKKRERDKYQTKMYGRPLSPAEMKKDRFRAARELGFRSGLEVAIARQLEEAGVSFSYEPFRIPFEVAETRHYKPDILLPNGILVEAKGEFPTSERKKHRLIKAQYPELELRFVFSSSRKRISKQSQTTYGQFCEKQGIPYADKTIPESWLKEPVNRKSLAIIRSLMEDK